jgi:hypothetical protein
MLLYNAIGRHTPGIITAIESDNDNAARRIVMCDRMSGFSHIHITKMFDITVTTANDENTAMYQIGDRFDVMATLVYILQTAERQWSVIVTQNCKDKPKCNLYNHIYYLYNLIYSPVGGRRGRDRMVVGFTTTYLISAYYH